MQLLRSQLGVRLLFEGVDFALESQSEPFSVTAECAAMWYRKLSHAQAPWIFYSQLRAVDFCDAQKSLLSAWMSFLQQVTAPGLPHLRVHVLAVTWQLGTEQSDATRLAQEWLRTYPPHSAGPVHIVHPTDLHHCEWFDVTQWLPRHVWRLRPDLRVMEQQILEGFAPLTRAKFALDDLRTLLYRLRV